MGGSWALQELNRRRQSGQSLRVLRKDHGNGIELLWYRGHVLLSRLFLSHRFAMSTTSQAILENPILDDNGLVMDA